MTQVDSVDLFADKSSESSVKISPKSIKLIIFLFFIFIFVISDFFVNNVVASFGNTLEGRNLTTWGVVVQGIMLVLFYIITAHLIEKKYI